MELLQAFPHPFLHPITTNYYQRLKSDTRRKYHNQIFKAVLVDSNNSKEYVKHYFIFGTGVMDTRV